MLDPLLVQLFGRDVTDRLALAGYEDTAAVARVSAEELAEDSGIGTALARRIIAVAVEADRAGVRAGAEADDDAFQDLATPPAPPAGPDPAPDITGGRAREVAPGRPEEIPDAGPHDTQQARPPDPAVDSPAPPAPAERHVRRPFRRPQSALASPPEPPPPGPPAGDGAIASVVLDDRPPFIDNAGLISSLGLASRKGPPRGVRIAVAEEILDAAPSPAPESMDSPSAARPAERPRPALLKDSFWSFGSLDSAARKQEPRGDRPEGPAAGDRTDVGRRGRSGSVSPGFPSPRRRSGDGH